MPSHGKLDSAVHPATKNSDPERRRIAFIQRFEKHQRRLRQWVAFSDIANWASHAPGDALSDKDRLNRAYIDLFKTMRAGDFNVANRSKVLCLQPRSKAIRLTAAHLDEAIAIFTLTTAMVIKGYLSRCWVPRALAAEWFKRRNQPLPAHLFPPDPLVTATAKIKVKPKERRGRYNWEPALQKISEEIFANGLPKPGDGGQARLERHAIATFPVDGCPTESVIKEKVRTILQSFRQAKDRGRLRS